MGCQGRPLVIHYDSIVENIFSTLTALYRRTLRQVPSCQDRNYFAHSSSKMLVDPLGQPKFLSSSISSLHREQHDLPSAQTSCASEQVSSSWNMYVAALLASQC